MMRIALALVWLGIAACAFVGALPGRFTAHTGWLAIILAGYNLARWHTDRRLRTNNAVDRPANNIRRAPANPEFDFGVTDPPSGPND